MRGRAHGIESSYLFCSSFFQSDKKSSEQQCTRWRRVEWHIPFWSRWVHEEIEQAAIPVGNRRLRIM
jgi:hypothetical protein